jgi:hypothetical protein
MFASIILLTFSIICYFLAGASEGVMDKINFHYFKSIFREEDKFNQKFWNPEISWENKYKDIVNYEPKFWGSTTFFVAFTDAWHFFQLINNFLVFLGLFLMIFSTYYFVEDCFSRYDDYFVTFSIVSVIICRLSYGAGFRLFYDKLTHLDMREHEK